MANEAQLAAARSGADDIDVDGNGITGATSTLASTADAIQSRNMSGNHGSGTSTTTSVVADDGELEHERPAAADGPTHEVYTGLAETQDSENIQNGSTASGGVAPTFGVGAQGGISFRDDGADDVVVVGDTSNSFGTASHTAGSSTYTATEEIRDSLCDRRDEKQELLRGFETENSQDNEATGVEPGDDEPLPSDVNTGFGSLSQDEAQDSGIPPRIQIPTRSRGVSPASSKKSPLSDSTPLQKLRGVSPASSKNSPPSVGTPLSAGTPPRKTSSSVTLAATGNAGEKTLGERLEAALGEGTGADDGDRRVLVSASSGVNLRAVGSREGTPSPHGTRRGGRGQSVPTSVTRGSARGLRVARSTGSTPRTSRSPENRRGSISFVEYVASSHSELSLLEASRHSPAGSKRPRDRNALRVAVRVRPIIAREKGSRTVVCEGGDGRLVVVNPKKFRASPDAVLATASAVSRANMATSDWLRRFDYDRVFWSHPQSRKNVTGEGEGGIEEGGTDMPATQSSVYEGLGARIVDDAINGINCSCFAYGHTGSGKTYSMFGAGDSTKSPFNAAKLTGAPEGDRFGLVPRVCYHLLRRLKEGVSTDPAEAHLSVHFVEIYNDKIRDLLHPGADSSAFRVREHPQTGPYVDNLVPVQVESWSQLRQLLALGCAARTERDTPENSKSSRGHAILTLESRTAAGPSRVQMVDLAGSERESSAKTRREIDGSDGRSQTTMRDSGGGEGVDGRTLSQRLRETAQIKKALSNLGIIIKGLSRGDRAVGLPFRDSILTWLLKEALSGRARTTMLATISPSSDNYVETMNTLKYAERLRKASVHMYWNREVAAAKNTKPPESIRKEMESLMEQLQADGIEAKRQVLYQTVADPQQRLAKLTMKDPRRARRFSDSGVPSPTIRRFSANVTTDELRRTTLPGTPSPNRFGWKPFSPTLSSEASPAKPGDGSGEIWGSPIVTAEDTSVASAIPGSAKGTADEDHSHPPGGTRVSLSTQTKVTTRHSSSGTGAVGGVSRSPGVENESANRPDENMNFRRVEGRYGHGRGKAEQLCSHRDSEVEAESSEEDSIVDTQRTGALQADGSNRHPSVTSPLRFSEESDGVDLPGGQVSGDVPVGTVATPYNEDCSAGNEDREQSLPDPQQSRAGPDQLGVELSDDRGDKGSVPSVVISASAMPAEGHPGTDGSSSTPTAETLDFPVQFEPPSIPSPGGAHREAGGSPHSIPGNDASRTGRATSSASPSFPPRRVSWEQQSAGRDTNNGRVQGTARPKATSFAVQDTIAEHGDGEDSVSAAEYASAGRHGGEGIETGRRDPAGCASDMDGGDQQVPNESFLQSSVEYGVGTGMAALAASGVFDMSGTSGEVGGDDTEEGISVEEYDSLDGDDHHMGGLHARNRVSQEPQVDTAGLSRSRWMSRGATRDVATQVQGEDAMAIVDDLMREVEQLRDEVLRLNTERRKNEASQQQAWAASDEADRVVRELRLRLTSTERSLAIETERAEEAEKVAQEAATRADHLAVDARNAVDALEDARKKARELEQRAVKAEARAQDLVAQAKQDGGRLSAFQDALEEQVQRTQEANRRAEKSEAALEAAGEDIDAAVKAVQRTADVERKRAEEAENRAQLAGARSKQLAALAEEHGKRLASTKTSLEEASARAEEAEERERQATTVAEELVAQLQEREERLAKAKEAGAEEAARADAAVVRESEAAEGKRNAENKAKELTRMLEKQREELEEAKREKERSLAEVRAAAETEMERSATRRDGIMEERDRALEQVEDERTEVLRLTDELNKLRLATRQEVKAAQEREAALKTLLADEAERSRAEQADVEELLSLISSTQDSTRGDAAGVVGQPQISIAGARFVVERERAEREAARDRLLSLKEENNALRREQETARQVPSERVRRAEEDRDKLARENEALFERLEESRAQQRRMTHDRETQARAIHSPRENQTQTASRESEAGASTGRTERDPETQALRRGGRDEVNSKSLMSNNGPGREGNRREEEKGSELVELRQRLANEERLRQEQAQQFQERLEEVKREAEEKTSTSIRKVLEGVKTQAKHIKDTVTRLESERDQAVRAKGDATKELEDMKSKMKALHEEHNKTKSEFEEQMKNNARERAALWLAVNKLDVLEAAKDSMIENLQADGETKKRDLRLLEADNNRLAMELGQIDMSLMQALEDNGLTLDNVNLQNSVMSRRLGRRSVRVKRHSTTNGHAAGTSVNDTGPPIKNAGPLISPQGVPSGSRGHLPVRAGSRSAFGRDEGAVAWASKGRIRAGEVNRDTVSKVRRRTPPQQPHTSGLGMDMAMRDGTGRQRGDERSGMRPDDSGGGDGLGDVAESVYVAHGGRQLSRRMYETKTLALPAADGWDPAIHTIEREIEQLSDRLNGQGSNVSNTRRDDESSENHRHDDPRAQSNTGKRCRVRSNSEVSPARVPDTQRPRRESRGAA